MKMLRESPAIWKQGMVRREILPRLMRRLAVGSRRENFVAAAQLLDLAPGGEERAALMKGFEQAFEGGALPDLPEELVEALAKDGQLSLTLRVRRGDQDALVEAIRVVSDDKSEGAQRLRLIKTFGEVGYEQTTAVLLQNVGRGHDPAVRRAALAALQSFSSEDIGETVVRRYRSLTDDEQPAAQALLASRPNWSRAWLAAIEAGTLNAKGAIPEAVAMLRRHSEEEVSQLVRKHFGESPAVPRRSRSARILEVRSIIDEKPGNPYRGRPLFKQRCANCHVLFYSGGKIGPDLTSYQRDDLDTMLTSIIDPQAEIREGYEGFSVKTKEGRLLTGFLADGGPQHFTIRGFDGNDHSLSRDQISEMTPLGRSLMPEGLLDDLGDQQVRDLFAYLRSAQPFLKD